MIAVFHFGTFRRVTVGDKNIFANLIYKSGKIFFVFLMNVEGAS